MRTLLYDFYGELLTERRRKIVESVLFDDLSLSEAADEYGITRQAVHDVYARSIERLSRYEEQLGLVAKFLRVRDLAQDIKTKTDNGEILRLCDEMIGVF